MQEAFQLGNSHEPVAVLVEEVDEVLDLVRGETELHKEEHLQVPQVERAVLVQVPTSNWSERFLFGLENAL